MTVPLFEQFSRHLDAAAEEIDPETFEDITVLANLFGAIAAAYARAHVDAEHREHFVTSVINTATLAAAREAAASAGVVAAPNMVQ